MLMGAIALGLQPAIADGTGETELMEAASVEVPGGGGSLRVASVDDFDPDGGSAIIEEGTSAEELLYYSEIDEEDSALTGISRPDPLPHDEGASIQTSSSTTPVEGDDIAATVDWTIADEGKDVEYVTDGVNVLSVTQYPLGTLNSSGSANSSPTTKNMTKVGTKCYKIDSPYTYGYHCLHGYKPSVNDGDPTYNYRVAWWTGSSRAKCCNDLKRIRDKFWAPAGAPSGQQIIKWAPSGTSNPSACNTRTVTVSASYQGVGASVSSSHSRCPDRFGPDAVSGNRFDFGWWGERDRNWWVGMAGGLEFRFKPANGYKYKATFDHRYCTPDWLC